MARIKLSVMNDDDIDKVSSGQIVNMQKYNNRFKTPAPVDGGLFCSRIFGPMRNYTCNCGIFKYVNDSDEVKCEICGVPYISSEERRNRSGHIDLNTWVINPLVINHLSDILNIGKKDLISFTTNPESKLRIHILPSSLDKSNLVDKLGNYYRLFFVKNEDTGIGSIPELVDILYSMDIDSLKSMELSSSRLAEVYRSNNRGILDFFTSKILVKPAGLRDRQLIGDTVSYNPINFIYVRIIRESMRIAQIKAISDDYDKRILIKLETIAIQKLYLNLQSKDCNYDQIKIESTINSLGGKEGLIRNNLLGKRLDFSGRSVITAGPSLDIDEVGIPMKMLHELLKPIIIGHIVNNSNSTYKSAMNKFKLYSEEIKKLIELYAPNFMMVMNRAPSLHRYSVMSFRIRVTYDKCIYLPPMACAPFNADNDGDQMACYLMLSESSMEEVKTLISFKANMISSVIRDKPNVTPSHEQIVGGYLLTRGYEHDNDVVKSFKDIKDIIKEHELGYLALNDMVNYIWYDLSGNRIVSKITVGVAYIKEACNEMPQYLIDKKGVKKLILSVIRNNSPDKAVLYLTRLQKLFFSTVTKYGLSISYEDTKKSSLVDEDILKTKEEAVKIPYGMERAKIWDTCINKHVDDWFNHTEENNPLLIMSKSGARVTPPQIRSMVVAKGLLADSRGSLNFDAISKSLSDGLEIEQYFRTCGPARHALAGNFFIVPVSGYLERQLSNLCSDLIVGEFDCNSTDTIEVDSMDAIGRYTLSNLNHPKLIHSDNVKDYGDKIRIRSPITCKSNKGVCSICCGNDPATDRPFRIGSNAGIMASQSLCEVLSQSGLRGKHTSGAITLATFSKKVENVAADVVKFLGAALGGAQPSQNEELIPFNSLEGESTKDIMNKGVLILHSIYKNAEMDISILWHELVIRSMCDISIDGNLRSHGYNHEEPMIQGVHHALLSHPSWLKKLGFGYISTTIDEALREQKPTLDVPVERLMQGLLPNI